MPHIVFKLYPGRTEEQQHRLARRIAKDVVGIAGCEEKSVSVAIEEVRPQDWNERVYRPEIIGRQEQPCGRRGYFPRESGLPSAQGSALKSEAFGGSGMRRRPKVGSSYPHGQGLQAAGILDRTHRHIYIFDHSVLQHDSSTKTLAPHLIRGR